MLAEVGINFLSPPKSLQFIHIIGIILRNLDPLLPDIVLLFFNTSFQDCIIRWTSRDKYLLLTDAKTDKVLFTLAIRHAM